LTTYYKDQNIFAKFDSFIRLKIAPRWKKFGTKGESQGIAKVNKARNTLKYFKFTTLKLTNYE
jgi:hypothetical protein